MVDEVSSFYNRHWAGKMHTDERMGVPVLSPEGAALVLRAYNEESGPLDVELILRCTPLRELLRNASPKGTGDTTASVHEALLRGFHSWCEDQPPGRTRTTNKQQLSAIEKATVVSRLLFLSSAVDGYINKTERRRLAVAFDGQPVITPERVKDNLSDFWRAYEATLKGYLLLPRESAVDASPQRPLKMKSMRRALVEVGILSAILVGAAAILLLAIPGLLEPRPPTEIFVYLPSQNAAERAETTEDLEAATCAFAPSSLQTQREDAQLCADESTLFDPCFSVRLGTAVVCPIVSEDGTGIVELVKRVDQRASNGGSGSLSIEQAFTDGPPWLIQVQVGEGTLWCKRNVGSSAFGTASYLCDISRIDLTALIMLRDDEEMPYIYVRGGGLTALEAADLDRTGDSWDIALQDLDSGVLQRVIVLTAWF